jgi:hypothetical protein
MTNVNTPSPSRLNRAMPWHHNSHVQPERGLGIKNFAPGFSSYFHPQKATCSPSLVPSNQRISQAVGNRLPTSDSIQGPSVRGRRGLNTRIDGRYIPK